jgi:hypothetical protein
MRRLLIAVLLFPLVVKSQSFGHSVFIAPNATLYRSSSSEAYSAPSIHPIGYRSGLGGSVGYRLEYHLPKTLSWGASLEYLLTRAKLYTSCDCIHTADRTVSVRNLISAQSMDLPIYLKLRTNHKEDRLTYFQGGMGLSWLLAAHRKVDLETNFLGGPGDYIREELSNESFSIFSSRGSRRGTFLQLGIGQHFRIKESRFFSELAYRQDINSWVYRAIETPAGVKVFPLQRQSISLKVGMNLNGQN